MKQPSERKWFYGYQIVAASSIIQMLYLSLMFSFGVLFKEFESEFGWSRASIAGASSMMMLMMGTLGIFLGKANDLFGPRLVLTLTGLLYGLGFMLMSIKFTVGLWGLLKAKKLPNTEKWLNV